MVRDTLLGFPSHSLPYRYHKFHHFIYRPKEILRYPRPMNSSYCPSPICSAQIQTAVQKQLDYLHDVPESKSKVLNIDWDPNVPDFDS